MNEIPFNIYFNETLQIKWLLFRRSRLQTRSQTSDLSHLTASSTSKAQADHIYEKLNFDNNHIWHEYFCLQSQLCILCLCDILFKFSIKTCIKLLPVISSLQIQIAQSYITNHEIKILTSLRHKSYKVSRSGRPWGGAVLF